MSIEITLPAVTPDFDAGTINLWTKAVGDKVTEGEVIFEVETDKAMIEVEAKGSGILGKILVEANSEEVAVNTVVAILLEENETMDMLDDLSSTPSSSVEQASTIDDKSVSSSPNQQTEAPSMPSSDPKRIFSSPSARRVASINNVELSGLSGSGPKGRILKSDVDHFVANNDSSLIINDAQSQAPRFVEEQVVAVAPVVAAVVPAATTSNVNVIKHSSVRKVIAKRLVESKQQIPHFYLTIDCEAEALDNLRHELNAQAQNSKTSYKLTINDFIIKAAALALQDAPQVNASWTGEAVLQYKDIDISIAVATENGLITPILRQVDSKGLEVISNQVKALAEKAKNGRLQPADYQGGGFSISNLGKYGIKSFSAIINPPQSCILAVGASEKRPVVKNDELAIATMFSCTLSADHRVVDGAVAAEFLQTFKHYIENPLQMMLRGGQY
ncbi:MAG: pyruvate dehydrogenase E2 component (dihydrolipoamide acetyltransferase) [Glaciecola sp.]